MASDTSDADAAKSDRSAARAIGTREILDELETSRAAIVAL